ncbi:CheR family methyltransferase [Steroidobacter flavus]|uniref:CheR family methyltransferase n=1 Tax=Steroidobacter flavus TaxID=1842136 RepID=A0ABV8SS28_9GAMM
MASNDKTPGSSPDESATGSARQTVVIGVGAPAHNGGLDEFLRSSHELRSAALVIVLQSKDPVTPARLDEIKAAATSRLVAIEDQMSIEAGRIYLAPEGMKVTVSGNQFRVRPAKEAPGERGTIDSFLVPLAEQEREFAVGVVLAGVGGDGTLGVTSIKEQGGFTLAQRLPGEDHSEMSLQSAVAIADVVAPINEIVQRLVAHLGSVAPVPSPKNFDEIVTAAGPALARIATVLRNRTGHDFHGYKHNTFLRRVQRRMQVTQMPTIESYLDHLRAEPDEAQNLFNDLLIGVTHFFRDRKEFEALEREVIPKIFEGKGSNDHLRVWVLGCATGEEAYSIAILLREYSARLDAVPHIQIFATDIDNRALAQARVGRFAASAVQDVTPERLARWFVKEGDTYCIVKELREMCIFSQHNLIKDAPFSRLDLVSCRNLLIYLNAELQNRVIPLFHFALRPGGFLFLGNSENVTRHSKLFATVDRRYRIFRHVEGLTRILPDFPLMANADRRGVAETPRTARVNTSNGAALNKQAERIMERYAPAYLIVDENHDVVHFSGRTGKYLDPPTGLASLNIMNLVHRDLRMDLRSALHRAESENTTIRVSGLRVGQNGKTMFVTLSVEPIESALGQPSRYAIILQDGHIVTDEEDQANFVASSGGGVTDEHVRRLEEELRVTRDRLQATIEELESTNEELKASNEEYQSVNEELQSSNEELETSKEELQSLNEELQTVNGELAHRVEELARANSDLKNLLESTQIATIFLDNDLRITSFTPEMSDILHLIETDIGRPIHHIAKKIAYEDLEGDVRRVIRTLGTIERETVSQQTNSHYLTRILPYRSINNVIEGAVVTFLDVTRLSRAEERLRESEARLRAIVEGIPQLVWRASDGGHRTWSSPQWTEFTGQSAEAALEFGWLEVVAQEDRERVKAAWQDAQLTGQLSMEHKLWNVKENAYKAVHLRATPVWGDSNKPTEWFGTATDVHELLRLQDRQQVLLHELQHRVRNILAVVRSVAQRTGKSSDSVEAYSNTLAGRINAMARTHNVLTSSPDASIDLHTLIRSEIEATGNESDHQLSLSGPEITLSGKAAENIGLAMHELATNALKYGALANPTGHINVAWNIDGTADKPALVLTWRETKVDVSSPSRRGFGSELIEHVVPYDFGGTGKMEFKPDGLLCVLSLPLNGEMRVNGDELETGTGHR